MAGAFVVAVVLSTPNELRFTPETFTGEIIVKGEANPAKRFSISGSVVDLYPGAKKTLTLRFANPLQQDIRVVTTTIAVVSTDKPGCPTAAVTPTNYAAPAAGGVVVVKKGTATVEVPISMGPDADNACSGATFSLAYSGTAVQA